MNGRNPALYISATVVLVLFSIIAFSYPLYKPPSNGELEIKWSLPSGIRFRDLDEGDHIDLTYEADSFLSVYLLTFGEAEEFRSPSYYKKPLPPPVHSGMEGDVELKIEEEGDYEILFYNGSFSRNHHVSYTYRTHFQRDVRLSIISGTCLLLLSLVPVLILFLRRKKDSEKSLERGRFK